MANKFTYSCVVSSEPQYDVSLISGTIHKLGVETNASSQEPDNLTVSKQSSMTVALADSIGGITINFVITRLYPIVLLTCIKLYQMAEYYSVLHSSI